jgi:hypothetical protein
MTLTVRLDEELEREFAAVCRLNRTAKSSVVQRLIRDYVRGEAPAKTPYELAVELGLVGSVARAPAAGREHSRYLKEKVQGKARARRAR